MSLSHHDAVPTLGHLPHAVPDRTAAGAHGVLQQLGHLIQPQPDVIRAIVLERSLYLSRGQ